MATRQSTPSPISNPPMAALRVGKGDAEDPQARRLVKPQQVGFPHDQPEGAVADEHARHNAAQRPLRRLRPRHGDARDLGEHGEPGAGRWSPSRASRA